MKKFFGCFVVGLASLSVLCSAAQADSLTKPTTNRDGYCTDEVVRDYLVLQRESKVFLKDFFSLFASIKDPSVDEGQLEKNLFQAVGEFRRKVEAFRYDYGYFSCKVDEGGQEISPIKLYKSFDEMDQLVEEMKAKAAGISDCPADLAKAREELMQEIRPQAGQMLEIGKKVLEKAKDGQSIDSETETLKSSASFLLSRLLVFRQKFSSAFSCVITNSNGTRVRFSSEEIKEQIRKITGSLEQLR